MATTTIQVQRETRDHLAELAKERGLSIGQLVEELAAEQLTAAQRAERLAADRDVARGMIGVRSATRSSNRLQTSSATFTRSPLRRPRGQGHRCVITLEQQRAQSTRRRPPALNLLAGNMAKTPGDRLNVPALCLMQAEATEENLARRVLAFSAVTVDELNSSRLTRR